MDSAVTHYSIGQWTDYVRNLVDPQTREAMALHLERDACPECNGIAGWVAELSAWAADERQLEVPAELTARAQAVFPKSSPAAGRRWIDSLERIVAECLFAAGPDWLPQGVRSAAQTLERRLVYRAETVQIELSLDSAASPGQIEITGQAHDQSREPGALARLPVQVLTAHKVIAETETNQFGEFVLLVPIKNDMSLSLALPDQGRRIEVPFSGGRS